MHSFAQGTSVVARGDQFELEVTDEWESAPGTPNGGYLASAALRAVGIAEKGMRPSSFYCAFLNRAQFGTATIKLEDVRRGSNSVCLQLKMTQDTRTVLQGTAWLVKEGTPGYDFQSEGAPSVPPPGDGKNMLEGGPFVANCWKHAEFRSHMPKAEEAGPGAPEFTAWHRFPLEGPENDPFLSAARQLFLADLRAFGPVLCQQGGTFWTVPYIGVTMDLHAHFYADSAPKDWTLMRARIASASHGSVGGEVEGWSADGRRLTTVLVNYLCRANPLLPSPKK